MKPQYHDLKIWPVYFLHIAAGSKNFEVRKDDRGYMAGDYLVLREWDPETGKYTGRMAIRNIMYICRDTNMGIQPGYAVFALQPA